MWAHIFTKFIQNASRPRAEPWGTFWIMEARKALQRWLQINFNYDVIFTGFLFILFKKKNHLGCLMFLSQEVQMREERWLSMTFRDQNAFLGWLKKKEVILIRCLNMKMSRWHSCGWKLKIVHRLCVSCQVTSWPMDILPNPKDWIHRKGRPLSIITRYCASSPGWMNPYLWICPLGHF